MISSNTKLLLSKLEIMFGIIRCHTYCLVLNHLNILGKYFLYVNALNTITYQLKYIAVSHKEKEFWNKWTFFSVFLKLYCVLFLLNLCILICFFLLPIYLIIY